MEYFSYISMTTDGYVATEAHSVEFLNNFQNIELYEYSYDKFISKIDTVIMGSQTYNFIEKYGSDPYKGKKVYVLSNTVEPKFGYLKVSGDASTLNDFFLKEECNNIWVMGGPNVHQQFIDSKLLKSAIVFVVPVELRNGVKLFTNEKYQPFKIVPLDKGTKMEIYKF